MLLSIRGQERPATVQPSAIPAPSNTPAITFPLKSGMLCKSEDGKLDGLLLQHTAPDFRDADKFADPDSLRSSMILMGSVLPEWGIFDKAPDAGGKLLAIGYGVTNGSEGAVFHALTVGSYPKKYDLIEGGLYAVTSDVRRADKGELRLFRLPPGQKTKQGTESPKSTTGLRECLVILRQLDGAKQRWAADTKKVKGDVPFAIHIIDYLTDRSMPKCPSGGKYSFNPVGQKPECSVHGDDF